MRIKDEFKKSGYFWLPSNPERKIPGVLVISDGGNVELEAIGLFDESIEGLNRAINNQDNLKRIVGHIENYGMVTLDDCFYINKKISFGGISKSSIHVNRAFIGIAYDENEAVNFNSFQFSVEGIDEWVGITGIKVDRNFEDKTASITYEPPNEILLNLNDGMKLSVIFSWTLPGFPNQNEAKITQKIYFRLASEQELPLNNFISTSYKIITLLCFAIDKIVSIESVSASCESNRRNVNGDITTPISVSVYYASLPYTENKPQIDVHRMLFRLGQIKNDAERIVNNWLDAYDEIDPALNLYFAAKAGEHKYLEGKFLALAQGLETYHRRTSKEKIMDDDVFEELTNKLIGLCPEERKEWLSGRLKYGNEQNLGKRIKSIIKPFKEYIGNSNYINKLIRDIVNTRNYLTHYEKSLESESVTGRNLFILCLKMEAIFQLHLLQMLGFTKSEVQSVLKNSYDLQQKIKEI